jgi:hypothetical protein
LWPAASACCGSSSSSSAGGALGYVAAGVGSDVTGARMTVLAGGGLLAM